MNERRVFEGVLVRVSDRQPKPSQRSAGSSRTLKVVKRETSCITTALEPEMDGTGIKARRDHVRPPAHHLSALRGEKQATGDDG